MNSTRSDRTAQEVARWRQAFQRRCRAAGVRVTAQRLAVYQALCADGSHPTADALWGRLRGRMPALSRTTVYRVLDSLEREGLIRRVSNTGGVARFDGRPDAHQHLVCRICGTIADVAVPSLARLRVPRAAAARFSAEHVEVQIVGRCAACRDREGDRPRAGARASVTARTPTTA
jgi:Fur family peroxide stress response transcriptional regulator